MPRFLPPRSLPHGALVALSFVLAGCGGGSGTGIVSAPPAPGPAPSAIPQPSPTSSEPAALPVPATPPEAGNEWHTADLDEAVALLDASQSQTFTSVGDVHAKRLPIIRYDAETDIYELEYDDGLWAQLYDGFGYRDPVTGYQPLYGEYTQLTSPTATDSAHRYRYSALLRFPILEGGDEDGFLRSEAFAIGSPTPLEQVPVSGNATYTGILAGVSDAYHSGPFWDVEAKIAGEIVLSFDFGAGALAGRIDPEVYAGTQWVTLPSLALTETRLSGAEFSGRFATSLAGDNSLAGLFTGPNAEEAIGSFTFPFVIPAGYYFIGSTTGENPIARGAFVAKR